MDKEPGFESVNADGDRVDEWGCVWKSMGETFGEPTTFPLKDLERYSDMQFPSVDDPVRYETVRKIVRENNGEKYVMGMLPAGIFQIMIHLFGFEDFMYQIAGNTEEYTALAGRLCDLCIRTIHRFADAGVDGVILIKDTAATASIPTGSMPTTASASAASRCWWTWSGTLPCCGPLNNSGNDYMGGGSFCFNRELAQSDFAGPVRSTDTRGNTNAQEAVGFSPKMYREFILPYVCQIAREFGLMYYGCCEPVSDFWENGVETVPNMRKVSVSAWCDEAYMAQALQGRNVIYSRKPSANFLGVQKELDEDAFRTYIRKTAQLTRDLPAEVIFRDIYKLHGNKAKLKRAVEIVREEMYL